MVDLDTTFTPGVALAVFDAGDTPGVIILASATAVPATATPGVITSAAATTVPVGGWLVLLRLTKWRARSVLALPVGLGLGYRVRVYDLGYMVQD